MNAMALPGCDEFRIGEWHRTMREATLNGGLPKTRIEALTDGIFAIAMTLMVFDIKLPSGAAESSLREQLFRLWPRFLVYMISFVMLGVYWVGHNNQYHYVRRSDRPSLWINVFFLMGVSLIPFSTGLLGQYPDERVAVAAYGSNLIMVGGYLYLLWSYATTGRRLVDSEIPADVVRLAKRRIAIGPAASVVAIAGSFFSCRLSLAVFVLIPLLYLAPGRIDAYWRRFGSSGATR